MPLDVHREMSRKTSHCEKLAKHCDASLFLLLTRLTSIEEKKRGHVLMYSLPKEIFSVWSLFVPFLNEVKEGFKATSTPLHSYFPL